MFPLLLSSEVTDRIARWDQLKQWERREIGQNLRRIGLSYREIAAVIPVHKGTLSGWCADLELTPEQRERLASKRPVIATQSRVGVERRIKARRERATVRSAAVVEAAPLLDDPAWIAGVVAYWSEGSKGASVRFANSDPDLVRLFMTWAMRYLDLSIDRFRIALHLHAGQNEYERKAYWSWQTGVPLEQFRKSYIKPKGSGHRRNVLYAGTASVSVTRSGSALQRVLGWIDALRSNAQDLRYTSAGR